MDIDFSRAQYLSIYLPGSACVWVSLPSAASAAPAAPGLLAAAFPTPSGTVAVVHTPVSVPGEEGRMEGRRGKERGKEEVTL